MPSRWLFVFLALPSLMGCTAAGGYIGAHRDAETPRSRVLRPADVGRLATGTLIYATLPGRETLKGRYRGQADSAGTRWLRMETGEGPVSLPLDSLSDLVAETHGHRYLARGLALGAAIDIVVAGTAGLLAYILMTHIQPIY